MADGSCGATAMPPPVSASISADPRDRGADDRPSGGEILRELHRAADRELRAARREADAGGGDVRRDERAVVDEACEADALGDPARTHELLDAPRARRRLRRRRAARAGAARRPARRPRSRSGSRSTRRAGRRTARARRPGRARARARAAARSRGAKSSVSAPLVTISTRSAGTPKTSTSVSRRRSVTGSKRCDERQAAPTAARLTRSRDAEHEPEPGARIEVDRGQGVDLEHDAVAQRAPRDDRRQERPSRSARRASGRPAGARRRARSRRR